jgi:3-oxoacyl-[acyl-carrier protein] reductase
MSSLQGRVALVTGSSRGIGAAIATLFAHEGAKVVIHGRDTAAMSATGIVLDVAGGAVTM